MPGGPTIKMPRGNANAGVRPALGRFEEIDDVAQEFDRLAIATDVAEAGAVGLLDGAGLGSAQLEDVVHRAAAHLAQEVDDGRDQAEDKQQPQKRAGFVGSIVAGQIWNLTRLQILQDFGVNRRRQGQIRASVGDEQDGVAVGMVAGDVPGFDERDRRFGRGEVRFRAIPVEKRHEDNAQEHAPNQ